MTTLPSPPARPRPDRGDRVALLATAPLAAQEAGAADMPKPADATGRFIDAEGTEIGAANLTDGAGGGVLIGIHVEGLPARQ